MTTDAEYTDWLLDVSRNSHRLFLFEADHADGTVHLASRGWLSETYQPYDGWIVGEPELSEDLENFLAAGDVDAINDDRATLDWRTLDFRGYRARWYYGDDEWDKDDFKQIATAIMEACRTIDGKLMRFDLMDGAQQLNRTFLTEDHTSVISGGSTIEYIITQTGLPAAVIYQNVSDLELSFMVNITMTPESIAATEIKRLTDSIGAYTRFSQTGQLEVFIPEITESPVPITSDDIVHGSIREVSVEPAYTTVTVELYDGTTVSESTGADTGELDEEIIYKTVLRVTAHATALAERHAAYHAVPHRVYEMEILDVSGVIQKGSDVSIVDPELTGEGIVTHIKRSPLAASNTIEVTI